MLLLPERGPSPYFGAPQWELPGAGVLNLSRNNDLSVVRSVGHFQTKTQTHPDGQIELVPSRGLLLRVPFAQSYAATSTRQTFYTR